MCVYCVMHLECVFGGIASAECECVKMGASRVVSFLLSENHCGPLRIVFSRCLAECLTLLTVESRASTRLLPQEMCPSYSTCKEDDLLHCHM